MKKNLFEKKNENTDIDIQQMDFPCDKKVSLQEIAELLRRSTRWKYPGVLDLEHLITGCVVQRWVIV